MKIASVQIDCQPGNPEYNLDKIYSFAQKASTAGADLVVFPELSDTGYDVKKIKDSASSWGDLSFQRLSRIAGELKINLVIGLSEKSGKYLYNSVAVLNKDGKLLDSYRKTHLITARPICEHKIFTAGNCLTIFTIGGIKFGLLICYDLRFPEMARSLALKGVQVLLVSSAWPLARIEHWKILTACRAIENQVYLVGANRVGLDGDTEFCGNSCILGPWGETDGLASQKDEQLIISDIDMDSFKRIRQFMPVFKHRRKDLYLQ